METNKSKHIYTNLQNLQERRELASRMSYSSSTRSQRGTGTRNTQSKNSQRRPNQEGGRRLPNIRPEYSTRGYTDFTDMCHRIENGQQELCHIPLNVISSALVLVNTSLKSVVGVNLAIAKRKELSELYAQVPSLLLDTQGLCKRYGVEWEETQLQQKSCTTLEEGASSKELCKNTATSGYLKVSLAERPQDDPRVEYLSTTSTDSSDGTPTIVVNASTPKLEESGEVVATCGRTSLDASTETSCTETSQVSTAVYDTVNTSDFRILVSQQTEPEIVNHNEDEIEPSAQSSNSNQLVDWTSKRVEDIFRGDEPSSSRFSTPWVAVDAIPDVLASLESVGSEAPNSVPQKEEDDFVCVEAIVEPKQTSPASDSAEEELPATPTQPREGSWRFWKESSRIVEGLKPPPRRDKSLIEHNSVGVQTDPVGETKNAAVQTDIVTVEEAREEERARAEAMSMYDGVKKEVSLDLRKHLTFLLSEEEIKYLDKNKWECSIHPSAAHLNRTWRSLEVSEGEGDNKLRKTIYVMEPERNHLPTVGGPSAGDPSAGYDENDKRCFKVISLMPEFRGDIRFVDYELFYHLKIKFAGKTPSTTSWSTMATWANQFWKQYKASHLAIGMIYEITRNTIFAALVPSYDDLKAIRYLSGTEAVRRIRELGDFTLNGYVVKEGVVPCLTSSVKVLEKI